MEVVVLETQWTFLRLNRIKILGVGVVNIVTDAHISERLVKFGA